MTLHAPVPPAHLLRIRARRVPHARELGSALGPVPLGQLRERLRGGRFRLALRAVHRGAPQDSREGGFHSLIRAEVAQVVEGRGVILGLILFAAGRGGVARSDEKELSGKVRLELRYQIGEPVHGVRAHASGEPLERHDVHGCRSHDRAEIAAQRFVRLLVALVRERHVHDGAEPDQLVIEGRAYQDGRGLEGAAGQRRLLRCMELLDRRLEDRGCLRRVHRPVARGMIQRPLQLIEHDLRVGLGVSGLARELDRLRGEGPHPIREVGGQSLARSGADQDRRQADVVRLRPDTELGETARSLVPQLLHLDGELDDVESRGLQILVPELLDRGHRLVGALALGEAIHLEADPEDGQEAGRAHRGGRLGRSSWSLRCRGRGCRLSLGSCPSRGHRGRKKGGKGQDPRDRGPRAKEMYRGWHDPFLQEETRL